MIRPGPLEIGLIIVIILMIFGAGKLPQFFEMVGKGVRSLTGGKKKEEEAEVKSGTKKRKSTKS
jgi:TatA/E family protein of Tat protein translocase